MKKLRAAWLLAEAMRLDDLARTKSEEEQRAFAEMHRRIHPHLKADFAILQAELAAWVATVCLKQQLECQLGSCTKVQGAPFASCNHAQI